MGEGRVDGMGTSGIWYMVGGREISGGCEVGLRTGQGRVTCALVGRWLWRGAV